MFTCLTPSRLVSEHRWNLWPLAVFASDLIFGNLRTEAEVERIEARTRIKAGAPVCSDGAYCVRPQIRRRMGPSESVRSGPQQ